MKNKIETAFVYGSVAFLIGMGLVLEVLAIRKYV